MKASIIIPCYNEAENIPHLLQRCESLLDSHIEVILVDNGSTDNSPEVLQSIIAMYPGFRSVRVEVNQGYGFGILCGLKAATGDILAWTHADMQTDPLDILRGLQIFNRQGRNILVKGRRIKRPFADGFFTFGMSIFETLLLRTRLWDINAQPNIFSRVFYETWVNPPNDFSLDLYVYFTARNQGLPVYRFPVKFSRRAHGVSSWNVNWAAKKKFIIRTINYSLDLKKRLFE
jgi:glycosyltransferase involved in cell wall biosynthesis